MGFTAKPQAGFEPAKSNQGFRTHLDSRWQYSLSEKRQLKYGGRISSLISNLNYFTPCMSCRVGEHVEYVQIVTFPNMHFIVIVEHSIIVYRFLSGAEHLDYVAKY